MRRSSRKSIRRSTTLVHALRSFGNDQDAGLRPKHRDGSAVLPNNHNEDQDLNDKEVEEDDEDDEDDDEDDDENDNDDDDKAEGPHQSTTATKENNHASPQRRRQLRRTTTLVGALRNHNPDLGLRPLHRDGSRGERSRRAPSVGRRSQRLATPANKNKEQASSSSEDDDDDEATQPKSKTKTKTKPKGKSSNTTNNKTPTKEKESTRSSRAKSRGRSRATTRSTTSSPSSQRTNTNNNTENSSTGVVHKFKGRVQLSQQKGSRFIQATLKSTAASLKTTTASLKSRPQRAKILCGVVFTLFLLCWLESIKPIHIEQQVNASNFVGTLQTHQGRMQQLEQDIKLLKSTLAATKKDYRTFVASSLSTSFQEQQSTLEHYVTEQIGVAAGKENTLRTALHAKITTEQRLENQATLEELRREMIDILGQKMLQVSDAGKNSLTDITIAIKVLQEQNSALFGTTNTGTNTHAQKKTNQEKKGGKAKARIEPKSLVGFQFHNFTKALHNIAVQQKDFESNVHNLVEKVQGEMNTLFKQQKTTITNLNTAATSSDQSTSEQVKAIQHEMSQISLRVESLGKEHAASTEKELASVRNTLSILKTSMEQMTSTGTAANNNGQKERKTLQTDLNKLDKETTDIKNEIQRVSKELAKQNVKTLKELQQVKADMKKSMKKTPSKAEKTPTATTTRQLNQADQDIIEGWIQSRIDKAIEDYTKVNNNNVAAAAAAAAAAKTQRSNRNVVIDGKITQDMILDWIDSAVETFAADRTGKVDYAVHSSGARIVGIGNARMTSSTYLNPNSTLSRRAARALGLSTHHGPEEVIKPSKGIGRYEGLLLFCVCFAFFCTRRRIVKIIVASF